MSKTLEVFEELADLFQKKNIYWIIGGHTGLIIQGVELEDDNEIDICTTKEEAYKINDLLKESVKEPVEYKELEHFKAHWGIFNIKGIKIEIMGDPKIKTETDGWIGLPKENITQTDFKDKNINCFTLKSEYNYYNNSVAKKERNKKIAEKIKEVM